MTSLFSQEEIRELYRRSVWTAAEPEGLSEDEWTRRFEALAAVFPFDADSPADPYFGPLKACRPDLLPFLPFFAFAVSLCGKHRRREIFLPGAFEGWQEAFTESLALLWGGAASQVLTEITSGAAASASIPLYEDAASAIYSGAFFREMALEYPVFARQLLIFLYDYAKHIRLLTEDLNTCLPKACRLLLAGETPTRVRKIAPPGSDRHQHGRTVHVLTLESGSRLVYKPHTMDIDRAFGSWLDWLSEKAGYGCFVKPESIDTPHGGICTYLSAEPLERREDALTFFRRAGFLMGSLYLLRGSDCHYENIIACGAWPAVVDLETAFVPEQSLLGRLAKRNLPYHISEMIFLPVMKAPPGYRRFEVDSLTSGSLILDSKNLPRFEGELIRGTGYIEEICSGFADALRTARLHPEEAAFVLSRNFPGCTVRLVLKATISYVTFLRALGMPEALKDPVSYGWLLDRIQVFGDWVTEEDRSFVTGTEKEALRRLDIPYFTMQLGESQIYSMLSWLEEQDEEKLETSLRAIRWALEFHTVEEGSELPFADAARPHGHNADAALPDVPDTGAARPDTADASDAGDTGAALAQLAERLALPLQRLARPIVAAKPEVFEGKLRQPYLIAQNTGSSTCLLDGCLGVLTALSAYCSICPERTDLRELVTGIFEKEFTDEKKLSPALVASEPGIADGTAGLLLGSRMCLEMGTLPEPLFRSVIERIGKLALEKTKLRFAPSDPLYGCAGLAAAVESLPAEYRTEELGELLALLYDNISEDSSLKNLPREELPGLVRKALTGEAGTVAGGPVRNHSLRFGNAGKLYNSTGDTGRTAETERFAALLSQAEAVLPDAPPPEDCLEVGLIHGMSGVLYSLCRYLDPEKVPHIL